MKFTHAAVVVLASFDQQGLAQKAGEQTSSALSGEVIELSPFVVDTTKDEGYQAGNTTSGSRLNTAVKDIAASIQTFTPEFIQDLGANSIEEIFSYGANVQKDIGDQDSGFGGAALIRTDTGQQDFVFTQRGIATSLARNFFNTNVKIDQYNTARLELSSGPNSVLFGLGSAGGIANTNTKRAETHRSHGSVRMQAGSHEFWRQELEWNQVLLRDRLAVRAMGILEDGNGWRHWDYAEQRRGTLAAIYKPLKNTTVTASYEKGRTRRHLSQPWNAEDGLALWLASGRPTRSGLWVAANAPTDQPLGMTTLGNAVQRTFIDNTGTYANYQNLRTSTYETFTVPAAQRAGRTLVPESVMPYDYSYSGPGANYATRFDVVHFAVEQRITEKLTAEFAYNRERTFIDKNFPGIAILNGDPNQTIANSAGVLVPNPHVGRLYFGDNWDYAFSEYDLRALRASLAYDLDLKKFGRHRMAGMFSRSREKSHTMSMLEVLVDASGRPAGVTTIDAADNRLTRRHYVTEGDYSTYHSSDFRTPFNVTLNGTNYTSVFVPANTNLIEKSSNATDTMLFALQSYFFADRLVTTLGLRRDRVTYRRHGTERLTASDPRVLAGERFTTQVEFSDVVEENSYRPTTRTLGGMWHAVPWLSFFYNHSSNAGEPDFRSTILPDGRVPPPSAGTGQDMGVQLELLGGKAFARVTYFRTHSDRQTGANIQNLITAPAGRINTALLTNRIITQSELDEWTVTARSALIDFKSEGWEANLTTNLNKNWALRATYSYTDLQRTNFFAEFEPWMETIEAFWDAKLAGGGRTRAQITTATAASQGTVGDEITFIGRSVAEQREVFELNYGLRPHKANVFTRYSFESGPLKNLFVGGGVRFQSANVVQKNFATGQVYRGEALFLTDALVGYRLRSAFFGKNLSCRLQLNVTNLLDKTDPIIGRYNDTFSGIRRVILTEPRSFRVTATVDF